MRSIFTNKMSFTTDELINANEHAITMGHTRVMEPAAYDQLDPEGIHVVVEQWPYSVPHGWRSRVVLKLEGVEPSVHDNWVWIDLHSEDVQTKETA